MQKITPCLWFNFKAQEAVEHYLGIFPQSRITHTSHYAEEFPELAGKVLVIEFELAGQAFQAVHCWPQFPFTEAISLSIDCESQDDVDAYWERLSARGRGPVRLAQGQVRCLLANRAGAAG